MDTLNPRERVACSDIHVVKNDLVIAHKLELKGEMCVKKYAPGCSEPYEVLRAPNEIQSAGKNLFLKLISNSAETDHYAAGTTLKIYDDNLTTPALVRTLTTLETGYPQHGSGTVKWKWRDGATASDYISYRHDVHSPSANSIRWSSVVNNWGTKNASDTWDYEYTLTIKDGGNTNFDSAGLNQLLELMTGQESEHFDATYTKMLPQNSLEDAAATLVASDTPSVSGSTCSWTFVEGTTVNNHDHYYIYIRHEGSYINRKLRKGADQLGPKTSSMERTITYKLSL